MPPAVTDRPLMADYGVPDDLEGVLPWTWALERLRGSRCYWVATTTADTRPHLMPVWGVWLDDHEVLFFSCSPSARKARNLAGNRAVTVATEDPKAFVSLEGTSSPTTDGPVLDAAISTYWAKYGDELPTEEDEADPEAGLGDFLRSTAGFAVTPQRAFGMIETPEDFGPRATRWRW